MSRYTNEKNILLLISLLKAHGIKKIIASPGSTNMSFIGSIQNDDYFEIYSCVDERSAAYIACGLSEESGEPVVISCTSATASRNYLSAMTEAYYRKLPILVVTSTMHTGMIGQFVPQVIDRSIIQKDVAKKSFQIPSFVSDSDIAIYTTLLNDAILELNHRGKGPVHINLATTYSEEYSTCSLPNVDVIERVMPKDKLVPIHHGRIGIFVGSHSKWSKELTSAVELFCDKYGAVVFCDRTSNYFGRHRINPAVVMRQKHYSSFCRELDLLIHIGEVSGSYYHFRPKHVWRVSPDGEIRSVFGKLRYVFEFDELSFFSRYNEIANQTNRDDTYEMQWRQDIEDIMSNIGDLPFSNIWIAKTILPQLPDETVFHFGILSSLRSWNFWEPQNIVYGYCNTGGFGIDGCLSTLIGASLANPQKIYMGVVGDLAFFYDINVLGNRHIGNNIRLIVINNGRGQEFCNFGHPGSKFNGQETKFIAAEGHFGRKSPKLIKNFVEDLGFEYMSARTKEELLPIVDVFCSKEKREKSIVFEVFTNGADESEALRIISTAKSDVKKVAIDIIKSSLSPKTIERIKKVIK